MSSSTAAGTAFFTAIATSFCTSRRRSARSVPIPAVAAAVIAGLTETRGAAFTAEGVFVNGPAATGDGVIAGDEPALAATIGATGDGGAAGGVTTAVTGDGGAGGGAATAVTGDGRAGG